MIKVEAGPYDVVATDGTLDAWRRLWQAATNGFASDANYQFVQGNNPDGTPNPAYEVLLDVPNLIDYMLVIIYAGNYDGPVYQNNFPNNFYAFRNRTTRDGFRFVTHDAELSLWSELRIARSRSLSAIRRRAAASARAIPSTSGSVCRRMPSSACASPITSSDSSSTAAR